jgi:hypothetical protein
VIDNAYQLMIYHQRWATSDIFVGRARSIPHLFPPRRPTVKEREEEVAEIEFTSLGTMYASMRNIGISVRRSRVLRWR